MGFYGDGGDGKGGSGKSNRLFSHIQDPIPSDVSENLSVEVRKNYLVDKIMDTFCDSLPSNYVSMVRGPAYSHIFRAFSESLAEFQIEAELAVDDKVSYDVVRTDFIYQLLGRLIFPKALLKTSENPVIDGDVTLREFLSEMVKFLLEGSRKDPIQEASGFLADASVEIIPKSEHIGKPASGWDVSNQFEFEINMIAHKETHRDHGNHWHRLRIDSQGNGETRGTYYHSAERMEYHVHKVENFVIQPYVDGKGDAHAHESKQAFPEDPITLQYNLGLILRALKPAHTLYEHRHLFVEGFGKLFEDEHFFEHESWRYEDLRKNWRGSKQLTGKGQTWGKDRSLLVDSHQDFSKAPPYSPVTILDGLNQGVYRVVEALPLPVLSDPTPRAYSTSPSGLTGTATVDNGDIIDPTQNFSLMVPGERFAFTEGPNEGVYRVASLLGNEGGPLNDDPKGVANGIRLAHSLLRIKPRMTYAVYEQNYQVGLDRLGQSEPQSIVSEDVTEQFLL